MDSSILTEIDFPIVLGIAVSIIVMSIAAIYDQYKGTKSSDPDTSISNSFESLGNFMDLSNLKVSNPFVGAGQKIRELINNRTISNENITSELTTEPKSNESGTKAAFGTLKSKLLSVKLSLPKRAERESKNLPEGLVDSKNNISTEKESDIDFDVDEIIRDKKNDLDFNDELINEMVTSDSLSDLSNIPESDSDSSLNGDLSIDMDDFDFGFDESGMGQDDGMDNEFSFEMPEDDDTYSNDITQVVAVDDFSFDDDSDDFIESLKNDIIIDQKDKIDFMSEMKGVDLNIQEIKNELEGVLADLKKYNPY